MNVSDQIIEVLNALCEKFGIVIDWTSQNIVPYVESLYSKLVTYEIATSIAWMVMMLCLSIGSIIATNKFAPTFKKGWEKDSKSPYECGWQVGTRFAIGGLVFINLITICVIGTQIMDIIKCLTFPEMYIFEYIRGLMQ